MSDRYPDPSLVINQIWRPTGQQVYALVDAAQDERIYPMLLKSNNSYCCLYRGEISRPLAAAAPYLVKLARSFDMTQWLLSCGWGRNWAVYLESAAGLEDLRRHFRPLMMVQDEWKRQFYFRFYDPRVLRLYLPTCTEAELAAMFGPVTRYCLEGEDYNEFIEYTCAEAKLVEGMVELQAEDQELMASSTQ